MGRGDGTDAIEVETIAEHQFPESHWFNLERFDRAEKGETELRRWVSAGVTRRSERGVN